MSTNSQLARSNTETLDSKRRGSIAIEAAIIIPVVIFITFAVLEFGMYFIKAQAVSNTINTAINPIQVNPDDSSIHQQLIQTGAGFLNFTNSGNYVCAQSYANYQQALNGGCSGNSWDTRRPAGVGSSQTYYVAIAAKTDNPINAFFGMTEVRESQIIQVGVQEHNPICGQNCTFTGNAMIQWGSIRWNNGYGQYIQFERPYNQVPVVTIQNSSTLPNNGENDAHIEVGNVTTNGFNVRRTTTNTVMGATIASNDLPTGWMAVGGLSQN